MTRCPICEKDVHPSIDMSEHGKLVEMCPNGCGAIGVIEPMGGHRAQPAQDDASVVTRISPPPGPKLVPKAPADPIALARAELADIEAQIERLEGLQRRRKRLTAMIGAWEAAEADDPDPAPAQADTHDKAAE